MASTSSNTGDAEEAKLRYRRPPPPPPPFVAPVRLLFPPPLPPPLPHAGAVPYYYGGAAAVHPPPPAAAMNLEVRSVTQWNFVSEVALIGALLPRFPVVVVDTEYPGAVHRPPAGKRESQLTADERYALVKANVDEVPIVQLGLTLCDAQGNFPVGVGMDGGLVRIAWEVHFSDFDPRRDPHVPQSVEFLRSQGIEFDVARAHGVMSRHFKDRLLGVLRAAARRRDELTWVAFGGAYDFAYLVKMFTGGRPLPETRQEFTALVRNVLGGRVFDAKYMADNCGRGDLRGAGLRGVAAILGVPPYSPCLAGPKSVTACHIYTSMRRQAFLNHEDGAAGGHEGHIDGLV